MKTMPKRRRKRKGTAAVAEIANNRPKKYKKWTEDSMARAMRCVMEGELGVNRAADQFGVPRTTLKDRMSGRVTHGSKSGPAPYLTEEEEGELQSYLLSCAEVGYPKTKNEVIGIVRKVVLKKRGTLVDFKGKGWWNRFVERRPHISLRKGDALALSRARAITSANIEQYYSLLKKTLEEHGLMGCASRIYNMDESGMPLDHKPPMVVARRGIKKVHCRTSGNKSQITIIACANAAGSIIPPMVIFEGQRFNPEWSKGEVPDTLYGMSDKGWTDQELFYYWLTELFVKQIPPARPVMLLVDGHSSHYEPVTIRAAAEQGIVIFCLPPHSTHVAQPLDVSFFRPLKVYWSEACHTYMQSNPGCVVTKYQFSKLFAEAWHKAIRPQNLMAGFAKTGVHPFDPGAIKAPTLPPGVDEDGPDDEQENKDGIDQDTSSGGETEIEKSGDGVSFKPHSASFSPEQIELFTLRHENGYDLFIDGDYVAWLLENHPDDVPAHVLEGASEHSDPFKPFEFEPDLFTDKERNSVNQTVEPSSHNGVPDMATSLDSSTATACPTSSPHEEPVESPLQSTTTDLTESATCSSNANTTPVSLSLPPHSTPVNLSNQSTPGSAASNSASTTRKPLTNLTEFLNYPNLTSTPKPSKKAKPSNGPRVLTSAEAIAMLEEKERKKREEEHAKEQRKIEREQKKLQREEE